MEQIMGQITTATGTFQGTETTPKRAKTCLFCWSIVRPNLCCKQSNTRKGYNEYAEVTKKRELQHFICNPKPFPLPSVKHKVSTQKHLSEQGTPNRRKGPEKAQKTKITKKTKKNEEDNEDKEDGGDENLRRDKAGKENNMKKATKDSTKKRAIKKKNKKKTTKTTTMTNKRNEKDRMKKMERRRNAYDKQKNVKRQQRENDDKKATTEK